MRFQKGDRVIVVREHAGWNNYALIGWTGVIVSVETQWHQFSVRWDKPEWAGGDLVYINQVELMDKNKELKRIKPYKIVEFWNTYYKQRKEVKYEKKLDSVFSKVM